MSATIRWLDKQATITHGEWSGDPLLVQLARVFTAGLEHASSIPDFDSYCARHVSTRINCTVETQEPRPLRDDVMYQASVQRGILTWARPRPGQGA